MHCSMKEVCINCSRYNQINIVSRTKMKSEKNKLCSLSYSLTENTYANYALWLNVLTSMPQNIANLFVYVQEAGATIILLFTTITGVRPLCRVNKLFLFQQSVGCLHHAQTSKKRAVKLSTISVHGKCFVLIPKLKSNNYFLLLYMRE